MDPKPNRPKAPPREGLFLHLTAAQVAWIADEAKARCTTKTRVVRDLVDTAMRGSRRDLLRRLDEAIDTYQHDDALPGLQFAREIIALEG